MQKLTFTFLCFIGIFCFFQQSSAQNTSGKDTSWHNKGFDFMLSGGMYFASKYNANYYNGDPKNENNINYLFKNQYWYADINRIAIQNHPFISDSVFLGDLPQDMSYKPSMYISLGAKYKFGKNWGISFSYSFTKLTASDVFTLTYKGEMGNLRPGYLIEHLIGKENRSFFDLTISYLFHPHPIVKPFLEMGLQFNYVKVTKFYALIENSEFGLLDYYNGVSFIPGVDIQKYNPIFGGPGYGMTAAAGLKLAFSKYISVDPTFYVSASSLGLIGYKNVAFNYGVCVRVVMSDVVFMK